MLESIAFDMEYAIADAAVAAAADYLGKPDDAEYFRNSSHSYRNYMDPETLFARGKMTDGSWRTPFNPYSSEHRANDYCEGNAWQYTWLAPHDYSGLVDFYGSREKFVERLDSLFAADSRIDGEDASPRHLRPHRSVRPRQRAEPPRHLFLYYGRRAVQDSRSGTPDIFRVL